MESLIQRFAGRISRAALMTISVLALMLSSCMTPAERDALNADVNSLKQTSLQLKKDLSTLQNQLSAQQKDFEKITTVAQNIPREESLSAIRKSQTMLFSQSSDVLEEIKTLRGRFDEYKFNADKQFKDLSSDLEVAKSASERTQQSPASTAQYDALVLRLNALEADIQTLKDIATSLSAGMPAKQVTAKDMYDQAFSMYNDKKFKEARDKWYLLVKAYPEDKLSGNALFWIGESFYSEMEYDDAILAYEEVIQKYKDNQKVPSAMLKQAFSFVELGDNKAAKGILKTLIEKYPDSDSTATAKAKMKSLP